MKYTRFGKTDLIISTVGFGAWAIGGSWEYGWGNQNDKDSIATLHAALEKGVNWIDTAPAYGLGHSEEVICQFLKSLPEADRPLIFTKCGLVWKKGAFNVSANLSPKSIEKEVGDSLKRLGIDSIDLYQIHWPMPDSNVESAWETLVKLKEQGKVKHIGVSNFSVEQLNRANAIAAVETLQPKYSLIARAAENDVLPWCTEKDVGVIVYSPMGSGLLSGTMSKERIASFHRDDWRRTKSDDFREPKLSRNLERVEMLKAISDRLDCTVGEIAIAWVLRNKHVDAAIVGMRRPDQTEVISAADRNLDDEAVQSILKLLDKPNRL